MTKEIKVKNSVRPALVDDENYEWLNHFEWELVETEDGLRIARRYPLPDGTYIWIGMAEMVMGYSI